MPLLDFQETLVVKHLDQVDSIIGDDMGLGKTVEAIELDKRRRNKFPNLKKRTLILAPMSVLSSWEDHFKEWQPGLTTFVIDPKARHVFAKAVADGTYDVYIMHWDAIRLMPELSKYNWFHIVADEAHRTGNRQAQVTVGSKKLKHTYLTLLTGTPCTTRPDQFWSLLNWIKPKVFTSFHRFYNHHVIFVQHDRSGDCRANVYGSTCGKAHKTPFKIIIGVEHVDQLLDEIKPYYTRRLKEEVIKDLPDKYFTRITVKLSPQQRKVYDQMRYEMIAWIGENEDKPLAASMAISKLVRLQQLACAYADVHWEKKRKRDDDGNWHLVDTRIVTLTDPSSKIDAAMELLHDNPDKQIVFFSQSKQVINLFAKRLEAAKISYGVLTGDVAQADRGDLVRAFQAGHIRVFAGTIAAGGEGITLTAADTVVFFDRAWSPAKNRQAEDRCHRIGQKNAVQVIDLVAESTVDAGRLQKIELNWQYIKRILGDKDAKTHPEGTYI